MKRRWIYLIGLALTACAVNPAERNNAANALSAQGSYSEAVAAYQSAQVAAPDEGLFYFNAAQAYMGDDEAGQAVTMLRQAIVRGTPEIKAIAWYNLGLLYMQGGQYREAADAFQQTLLSNPADADARYNLELAVLYFDKPTPTPFEQKTRPEEQQADVSATPTPNPSSPQLPTPTPPADAPPDGPTPAGALNGEQLSEEQKSTPQPRPGGEMKAEEARRLLEEIESDQPGIGGMPEYPTPMTTPPGGKDW
jgi:tetratricopeptide (TPR) repeat protein